MNRILVADDDRLMREILRVILGRAGYEVSLAEDGLRAVEMAAEEKPDLVLSDGMLPGLHGYEVCKVIKRFEDPPAVFLVTGSSPDSTDKSQIMRDCGADMVFFKPTDYGELVECIRRQLSPPDLTAVNEREPAGARVFRAGSG
jgi:DNA-binding response OmpR family regulator